MGAEPSAARLLWRCPGCCWLPLCSSSCPVSTPGRDEPWVTSSLGDVQPWVPRLSVTELAGGTCTGDAVPLTPGPAAGRAIGPLPTLAPPLSMMVAGQRRQLVVCVVSELAPASGHTVWISGGNGSALQSFAYGTSWEDGGTVCTVSLLPSDPPAEGDLACHVGPNRTSPAHSSSPIHITGMALLLPLLPVLHTAGGPWGCSGPGREQV